MILLLTLVESSKYISIYHFIPFVFDHFKLFVFCCFMLKRIRPNRTITGVKLLTTTESSIRGEQVFGIVIIALSLNYSRRKVSNYVYFVRYSISFYSFCSVYERKIEHFISIWNLEFRLGYAEQFTILKLALCLSFQGTGLPLWE